MKIVKELLSFNELQQMAESLFGDMVKGVVDVDRGLLAMDAELHSDLEALLLDDGSQQANLWGINIYPELPEEEWVECDSMINVRPSQGNRSRDVEDEAVRMIIRRIVNERIRR